MLNVRIPNIKGVKQDNLRDGVSNLILHSYTAVPVINTPAITCIIRIDSSYAGASQIY